MALTIETDVPLPNDEAPSDVDHVIQYPCEVCGREAGPYSGRGRKPRFCAEHKKNPVQSTTRNANQKNVVLASQAADVLARLNDMLAVGAMVVQYPETASVIAAANPGFRQQAYEALLLDPELCKAIMRGGAMSGKAALIVAYGMFAATVGSAAVLEYRRKSRAE